MVGNRQAASTFLNLVVAGKIEEAYNAYVAPDMRHHNPYFPGDPASLQRGMEENQRECPNKIFEIQRTIAEGDLVAVHSRLRMSAENPAMAVVHILRFENGRVAEMWDIGQPEPEESVNENGMF